jgi:hypothetical protein
LDYTAPQRETTLEETTAAKGLVLFGGGGVLEPVA